jgi:FG-GAP repeat
MDQRIRGSLARCLAVLVTPFVVLGVMAGMAPASSASRLPDAPAGRAPAAAAAVPVSLQAAIRKSLGTAVSAAGYSQQAKLTATGGEFGLSVALSALGTTALVGVPVRDTGTGAAWVFTLRHGTWSRTAELTTTGGAPFDDFGRSVALSALGSTALIGAPGRNKDTGAAYVFKLRRGTWSQTAELTASGGARLDEFGFSVALSARGGMALAGAIGRHSEAGAAYVFTLRRGTWSQTAELTGAPGDGFGFSVGLSARGSTALAGAPFHNTSTGAAYVFTLRRGTWSRTAVLTASHRAPGDGFGQSVALSALGSTALAGAFGRNPYTGAAYVFTLRRGTWFPTAKLTASDAAPGDEFGYSVALSAQGTTALAGAPFRNTSTGAAYVFTQGRGA